MESGRLQAYASIAEVVSAVAIVVSLLYVAYEFRQTSTMSSREADVMLFERVREANRLVVESPDLAELLVRARRAPDQLSEADSLRLLTFQHDFFDSWEMGWYYQRDGILEEATWREWDEWFAAEARGRPSFGWTENRRHFPGLEFRRHVDSALAVH